uniref:Uncharacterized protein n=1 Tax=Anopheles farauti TaxID=69004 RepID=A0A182QZ76_9DIPT
MQIAVIGVLCWSVACCVFPTVSGARVDNDGSSCTKIDFDQATLSSLRKCGYNQEFVVKRYDDSEHFDPYRPDAAYYLSHQWQGLTCGETVDMYSFNEETELRMAYNLVFDSGAVLEVRVYDEERLDSDKKPILVEVWQTTSSTEGWGFFRERLNKTVKQAKIQIEANINAGSDLAIEYLTIFNYEVETDECTSIDEFTTTVATTTTTMETTTEQPVTTTSSETVTTTTTATATETVSSTTTSSTVLSTDTTTSESTHTQSSEESTTVSLATTTTEATSTTTSSTTETPPTTATTTNAPRDDTSMQPFTTTTTTQQTTSTTASTTSMPPVSMETISTKEWLWMTLTSLFAILFVLAASAAIYLWFVNQHLERLTASLTGEVKQCPYKC